MRCKLQRSSFDTFRSDRRGGMRRCLLHAVLLGVAVSPAASLRHGGHHVQNVLSQQQGGHNSNASVHFYQQAVLDHFEWHGGVTYWSQRYYVDDTHWCGAGCPVFLYIGGEGPQGPPSDRLFMGHLAKELGALAVAVEHRYYGESRPVADMSVPNLRWLSSEQALADLARFVDYMKAYQPALPDAASSPPLTLRASPAASPWVCFGGSYPGSLSAWFKLKYPAAVVGAVASSAPVFAEYNFLQYAAVVGTALAAAEVGGSAACYETVAEATAELRQLVTHSLPLCKLLQCPREELQLG